MIYQIKNNQNKLLAEVEAEKDIFNIKYLDREFEKFLESEIEKGISALQDVYNKDSRVFVMSKQEVKTEDELFGFAVIDFLRMNGFKVGADEPKIDEDVKSILKEFPDDNKDKKELLDKLSRMTYLEKTLLLKELKKIN